MCVVACTEWYLCVSSAHRSDEKVARKCVKRAGLFGELVSWCTKVTFFLCVFFLPLPSSPQLYLAWLFLPCERIALKNFINEEVGFCFREKSDTSPRVELFTQAFLKKKKEKKEESYNNCRFLNKTKQKSPSLQTLKLVKNLQLQGVDSSCPSQVLGRAIYSVLMETKIHFLVLFFVFQAWFKSTAICLL